MDAIFYYKIKGTDRVIKVEVKPKTVENRVLDIIDVSQYDLLSEQYRQNIANTYHDDIEVITREEYERLSDEN